LYPDEELRNKQAKCNATLQATHDRTKKELQVNKIFGNDAMKISRWFPGNRKLTLIYGRQTAGASLCPL